MRNSGYPINEFLYGFYHDNLSRRILGEHILQELEEYLCIVFFVLLYINIFGLIIKETDQFFHNGLVILNSSSNRFVEISPSSRFNVPNVFLNCPCFGVSLVWGICRPAVTESQLFKKVENPMTAEWDPKFLLHKRACKGCSLVGKNAQSRSFWCLGRNDRQKFGFLCVSEFLLCIGCFLWGGIRYYLICDLRYCNWWFGEGDVFSFWGHKQVVIIFYWIAECLCIHMCSPPEKHL